MVLKVEKGETFIMLKFTEKQENKIAMRHLFREEPTELNSINQGWVAGASRSRVFLAPWSRSWSRLKKNQEPEPLGKKSQEPEPLKSLPAPQPCEKIKSIRKLYFSYSSLSK